MKKQKKDIVFYRTKNGSLAYFYPEGDPEAYRARKSAGKLKGPIKRELGNRKRYDNVEEETVRFRTKSVRKHGEFELGEGVLRDPDRENDIRTARDLYRQYGGNIRVRGAHEHEVGQHNPDYMWDKKLWDKKDNEQPTKNAVKNSVRTGIHQIAEIPGGVIVEPHKDLPVHEAKEYARQRLAESGKTGMKVLIIRNGKVKVVWKKK
ncbi:MAG: hypothetical protein IKF05_07825 [Erysipelotrichaceae bacterium]|nr:hypothetical protein [Erysipelotrichaceae bacterium]